MPDTSTKPLAGRADYREAWEVAVMHGNRNYAHEELRDHQPAPFDPTFHRKDHPENNGWHRASEITNPSAVAAMRAYLTNTLGKRVHPEVEEAWHKILVRRDLEKQVQAVIDKGMRTALHHPDVETVGQFAQVVIDALSELKVVTA